MKRYRILVAPDSFKGCLSPIQAAAAMKAGIESSPGVASVFTCPITDGGEYTVETIAATLSLPVTRLLARGPLGQPVRVPTCVAPDGYAMVDYASVGGLHLLRDVELDPLRASSFGLGQVIEQLLDMGHRKFRVFTGGSATVDVGVGALQALGVRFSGTCDCEAPLGGGSLGMIEQIDIKRLDPRLEECDFVLTYDVRNTLCGSDGAIPVFGPQKGVASDSIDALERGVEKFAKLIKTVSGTDIASCEGGGAAGGVAVALSAFLQSSRVNGFAEVSRLVSYSDRLDEADLVITGEGTIDRQTSFGKVVSQVGQLAREKGKPVVAIVGTLSPSGSSEYLAMVDAVVPITDGPMTLSYAMSHASELVTAAARRTAELIFLLERPGLDPVENP